MAVYRPPFAARASLPSTPPVPLSASVVPGTPNVITVVFDQELFPDTLDHTKWSGRLNDLLQSSVSAVAAGNTVVYSSTDAGADVGDDTVNYLDTAQDLRNRFGELPAASFTNFPVT
jgi:hypothetical protein